MRYLHISLVNKHKESPLRYLALLTLLTSALWSQKFDPAAQKGYDSIQGADLSTHVHVLASDSLEGRETTAPGQKKAAAYIAGYFQQLGLKPVGDSDTYLQKFDVEVTRIDPSQSDLTVKGSAPTKLSWGHEYMTLSLKDTTVTGPVVFVGYSDTRISPELRSKVAGRIVIALLGTRQQIADTSENAPVMRLFASRRDSGSVVVITVADDTGRASFDQLYERVASFGFDKGQMRLKDAPSTTPRMTQQQVRGLLSAAAAEAILKNAGLSLSKLRATAAREGDFAPVFIDQLSLTVRNTVVKEVRGTENVVGLLPGSDPLLRDQVVVFTGHYDHMGITKTGVIYHGADDDASGTAAVMEIAEAFVRNPLKPRRSVLFMTVAGEEKGLLGSSYYVTKPLLPLEKTVANLNTDMIGRMDTKYEPLKESHYVYVIGSDKISTELDSLLKVSNDQTVKLKLDYTYNEENDPNQFYRRSDHYNFAKNGIPVIFFFTGTHPDYHQPTDTADKILYDRMAVITKLIFATGWQVAQRPAPLNRNVSGGL